MKAANTEARDLMPYKNSFYDDRLPAGRAVIKDNFWSSNHWESTFIYRFNKLLKPVKTKA